MTADPVSLETARWLASHATGLFALALLLVLAAVAVLWRIGTRYGVRPDESRWPPALYLLGHFTLGFLLIAGLARLFAEIAEALGNGQQLGQLDEAFSDTLRTTLELPVLQVFAALTHLGDPLWLGAICLVVAIFLARARQVWLLSGWLAAVVGNAVLNHLLKNIFERSRPVHEHGLAAADGWSFPSGHTSGSVAVYGMLAYLLLRLLPPHWPAGLRLTAVLVATAVSFTVGCSRVFLQVHYASDVVAGLASGTAWLAVCIGTLELARYRRGRKAGG